MFELGCAYSGQSLSYTKMLGRLHDAGNTTTPAHCLELLAGAGMLLGLQKHAAAAGLCQGFSWRDRNDEVDFVVRAGRQVTAIEVKSGRSRDSLPGLAVFARAFPKARTLLAGDDGIAVEEFLERLVTHWVTA